jgi:KaiC/GvpD/RAD55 family RecA-like ATPase
MNTEELGVVEKLPILKKSRAPTGIDDLDVILEGGYQNPGNIMLVGPTGMEKNAFAYHFANAAPKKEEVYIICGDSSPNEIMKKADSMGISLDGDNIFFVDYTNTLGGKIEPKSTEKVTVLQSPGALNDLSLVLNEAIKKNTGKRMRVIFHTFSNFVLYNPRDSIRRFLSVIEGRLKGGEATVLYLIDEGVHDKQLLGLIEHGMDETYELEEVNGRYRLHVPRLPMPVPVNLGPAGITVQ